jgi:hypothetical protein
VVEVQMEVEAVKGVEAVMEALFEDIMSCMSKMRIISGTKPLKKNLRVPLVTMSWSS